MTATSTGGSPNWILPGPALVILLSAVVLTCIGLAVLFSATQGLHSDPYFLLRRQIIWLGIALLAGAVAAFLDWNRLRPLSWLFAACTLFALGLVLIPGIGVEVNGARRWLNLGSGMRLQVAEFAKIGLVFVLAHYLALHQREITSFRRGFLYPLMGIGFMACLIMLQPDYGTAFLCGLVGLSMLFLAGVRWGYLLPTATLSLSLFAVAIWYNPIRLRRILSFLDIEGNRQDSTYQLWQGMLAFVSGGVNGVGLGNGRQQMAYLPEAHTDFIFSIVGEELGFLFTGFTVLIFLLIFWVGFTRLRFAPDLFQFLLVAGALLFLSLQAIINLVVVTGLAPTKGMSLPFISYGGSNLVVMFVCIGIVISAFRNWEKPIRRKTRTI